MITSHENRELTNGKPHWALALGIKGNQGTTRGKEKNSFDLCWNRTHDLRIRSTVALRTKLRGRTDKSRGRF